MKKLFLGSLAFAAMALTSCSEENEALLNNTFEVFTGEIVTSESRTSLGSDNSVLWSDDDAINLFKKTGYYQKYKVKQGGSTTASFVYDDVNVTGNTLDQHYAVYPYSVNNTISGQTITVDLSTLANQTYTEDSFEEGKAVMVAKSETTNLPFKNALSVIRVNLNIGGPVIDATVSSIKITSADKALTGMATVDMSQEKQPAVVAADGGKVITLTAPNVKLSKEMTPFYIMFPAGNYAENELTVEVTAVINGERKVCEFPLPAVEIKRSMIKTLEKTFDDDEEWTGSTEGDELIVPNVVSTPEELAALLTADKKNISVELANDIDLPISSLGQQTGGSGEYKLGSENTETITINLNGKKLNITTNYWSNLGAKNANALFTIKNGTMTSSQPTGTWNSYDLTFSNCDYVIEDVVFDKAIALCNTEKSVSLKNVTINETHDYYAMWIQAEGQEVTIDGLTINSLGRGIKIDEQYVGAPAKVTLNINNATFTTAKKAAILVKSVAGAEINVSNANISGVSDDQIFAVWVDEDAATYADKVVVNGALCKVEGSTGLIGATSNEELQAVTIEDNAKIYLTSGEYVVPAAAKGKNVTFIGTGNPEDVKVSVTKVGSGGENCDYGLDGSNVIFDGITITTNSSNYIGYARCNGTYKNCIINGTYTLYGNSVFENCTFNVSGNVYNVWTWGAPTATFTECTFNSDGKAMLLYGQANTKLTIEDCVFNDNDGLNELKAAIEIGNDYNKSYELIVNNTIVNGYAINDKGINTGTTLWANKNSMSQDMLNVVVDGVDVY